MAQAARKLRWGIISTADIGVKKVIPGIQRSPHSEVVAIGSRDLKRAQTAAKQLGIPKAYGPMTSCWPTPMSTRSTTRCPTTCTCR